jgi:hypothetical protein
VRRHRGLALQMFGSFVRLLEQHGVSLRSSCALGDEAEKDFAGIKSCLRGPSSDLSSHDGFRGDVRTGSRLFHQGWLCSYTVYRYETLPCTGRQEHSWAEHRFIGFWEQLTSHDHDRLVTT